MIHGSAVVCCGANAPQNFIIVSTGEAAGRRYHERAVEVRGFEALLDFGTSLSVGGPAEEGARGLVSRAAPQNASDWLVMRLIVSVAAWASDMVIAVLARIRSAVGLSVEEVIVSPLLN